MRRKIAMGSFVVWWVLCLLCPSVPDVAASSLASLTAGTDGMKLIVFNPVLMNVQNVAALKRQGLIPGKDLTIIGVYHVRQKEDLEGARRFVTERGIDWFKFHGLACEVEPSNVFGKNGCSDEFRAIAERTDGVIFFGGLDMPPALYGKQSQLLTDVKDPYQHYLEISAVYHLLRGPEKEGGVPLLDARPDFPIPGICLGFQTINVDLGGDLVQDIWSDIYRYNTFEDAFSLGDEQWHNNPFFRITPSCELMRYSFHTLELLPDSIFCREMGFLPTEHPRVLSSHHQAVGRLGEGLTAIAASRDGKVIEAAGHRRFQNVLGMQFHPEIALLWDDDVKFRQKPREAPLSLKAILEKAPPSVRFQEEIWRWFSGKLEDSRRT